MTIKCKEVYRYDNYNKKWLWVYTRCTRNKLPNSFWFHLNRGGEYCQLPNHGGIHIKNIKL